MTKNPRRSEISIFYTKHAKNKYIRKLDNGQRKSDLYQNGSKVKNFYYIDISDPLTKKNTSGGNNGVSGVSERLLFNNTNTSNRFQ